MSIENFERFKKEEKLREIRKKVDNLRDILGMPIDEGIKEIVVMLNAMGFNTVSSCEGHIDWGSPYPWVIIQAPNEPEERFVGEKGIFERVAKKYGISIEKLRSGEHLEAYREALDECVKMGETEEYKNWCKENEILLKRINSLLEEFYREREIDEDVKLKIRMIGPGGAFKVYSGPIDVELVNEEEKFRLLERCRKEMNAFGEFLRKKYFSEI